jgi:transcriptional regulator with GAF, ATPase, and Fis domain
MSRLDYSDTEIIGKSQVIRKQLSFIHKAAKSDRTVLILGETGTGKDLTARKIHELSDRRDKPFVAIDCTNIPVELFESELFGFARGSFTGAVKNKMGLFEAARDGTIFLDEIGDLSLSLQAKILRIIEKKEVRRIGETIIRKINGRFIFATNRKLQEEMRRGNFRKDLYYRINVVRFYIPPLKERKEDIPLLANHFLITDRKLGEPEKKITQNAMEMLMKYDFPGNIRELENIIERASILSEGNLITEREIRFNQELDEYKKNADITPEKLKQVLENCRWNKTRAAIDIGKSRRQFYRLLEKHKLKDCPRKNFS